MGRFIAATLALAWLSVQPLASCALAATEEFHFQPAKVVSVSDVTIPFNSVANGTAVLEVAISENGDAGSIRVRRDVATITEEAVRAVKTWKFEPAKLNGKAVATRMTVAVTFDPVPPLCANVPLSPLIQRDDEVKLQPDFQPPGVTNATLPACPWLAVNPGTVILAASIDEAGKVQRTNVLRDAPPFTASALRAIGDWRFTPATLDGTPVESKAVLVFCFRVLAVWWRPRRP